MIQIKGILFDLDGTVIDSESLYQKGEIKLFKEYGVDIPEKDWKIFRGTTEQDFYTISMKKYNIKEDREIFINKGRKYIKSEFDKGLVYKRDFIKFYNYIKDKYKLGLVTASPLKSFNYVNKILNIKKYFSNVITNDDTNKSKPDPQPYILMMSRLNLNPSNTLIIEDSINGMVSAKSSKAYVAAITGSVSEKDMPNPDFIIKYFSELIEIIEK